MISLYDNIYCANTIEAQADSTSAVAVNGIAVDTQGFNTAVLRFRTSQSSSTPTTASIAVKLQESDDGSTNWADALDNTSTVIGGTADAKNHAASEVLARIEGLGGLNRKRYLRIVATPTLAGGSTPTVIFFGEIILGVAFKRPTNAIVSNT